MPPGRPGAVPRAASVALSAPAPLPLQQDIHRAAAAVLGLAVAVGVEPAGQGLAQGTDPAKHADASRFDLQRSAALSNPRLLPCAAQLQLRLVVFNQFDRSFLAVIDHRKEAEKRPPEQRPVRLSSGMKVDRRKWALCGQFQGRNVDLGQMHIYLSLSMDSRYNSPVNYRQTQSGSQSGIYAA